MSARCRREETIFQKEGPQPLSENGSGAHGDSGMESADTACYRTRGRLIKCRHPVRLGVNQAPTSHSVVSDACLTSKISLHLHYMALLNEGTHS